ncbi:MAG TPA: cyclic nucleotide-binding domain-containing protein [Anaerolineales bacterium]|nr:cyclic nucleotide-binding domain-containing protein [Anaerolineales bacterium]
MPKDVIDKLTLFKGMSPEQKELLKPLFVPCDCYGDSILFEQGERAEHLYLVVTGEVVIRHKPDDGPPITVARIKAGGVVGWSAALGNRTYTSAALCTRYTQMLRVRGADLRELCQQHPETGILILERLAEIIAERLRHTHKQVVELLKEGMGDGLQGW